MKHIVVACCFFIFFRALAAKPLLIETFYHNDIPMWDHITEHNALPGLTDIPYGAILPHHSIAARDIAAAYRVIAQKIQPKTIVIVCPNHYEKYTDSIITADAIEFATVYGTLHVNRSMVRSLVRTSGAKVRNDAFIAEHGIHFHTPFIKKFFPKATIVPILLSWNNPIEDNDRLASFLADYDPKTTFVLASVDFSHFQPRAVADFHDVTSFSVIKSFNYSALYDCELDSPASVYTLLRIMEQRNTMRAVRILHTNSDHYMKTPERETTSHQYIVFTRGEKKENTPVTVLITGNIAMDNNELFIRTSWRWDRAFTPSTVIDNKLVGIRGTEDRFLNGAQLYIFDMPTCNVPETYKVNSRTITIIQFDDNKYDTNEQLARIRELKGTSSHLIVLYRYGSDSNKTSYTALFRSFIDAGADCIVGKGKREIVKETYKGKPILYSLGDFIQAEGNDIGEIAGIVFDNATVSVTFFPIQLKNGIPEYLFVK